MNYQNIYQIQGNKVSFTIRLRNINSTYTSLRNVVIIKMLWQNVTETYFDEKMNWSFKKILQQSSVPQQLPEKLNLWKKSYDISVKRQKITFLKMQRNFWIVAISNPPKEVKFLPLDLKMKCYNFWRLTVYKYKMK